jgi:hypothetical protein
MPVRPLPWQAAQAGIVLAGSPVTTSAWPRASVAASTDGGVRDVSGGRSLA